MKSFWSGDQMVLSKVDKTLGCRGASSVYGSLIRFDLLLSMSMSPLFD
jgi:hypothetical protein